MESNSHRRSGSSARSTSRKRVVIGAQDTSSVRYKNKERSQVEPLRRHTPREADEKVAPRAGEAGRRVSRAKRDDRERRQRQIARRRVFLGVVATGVVLAFVAGIVALAHAPIFPVKSVVVTGLQRLTREQVLQQAAIPADATLPRLSAAEIERRLEADPWIARVRIVRHYPSTIELRVAERTPMAIVDAGGTKLWLVDGLAVWLVKASSDQSSTLPSIRDIENLAPKAGTQSPSLELRNALQVWQGLSAEMRGRVKTISAPTVDRTALILAHGVQVFVGSSSDIAKKDQVARAILAQHENVVYVNVRVVNRATWRGLTASN